MLKVWSRKRKSLTGNLPRDHLTFHSGEQAFIFISNKAECSRNKYPLERTLHAGRRQKRTLGSKRWASTHSTFALKELAVFSLQSQLTDASSSRAQWPC